MKSAALVSLVGLLLLSASDSSRTAIAQTSHVAQNPFPASFSDSISDGPSQQPASGDARQTGTDVNAAQNNGRSPRSMDGDLNIHGTLSTGGIAAPSGFKPGILVVPAFYNPNVGVDVIAAGAKGDCSTDDHDAIVRAEAAASGNPSASPLPLKFPRPPGGCYLTSTLTWQGYSMVGEVSSQGNNLANGIPVQLRSMPGQDLFNFPDPDDVNTPIISKSPYIQHMSWMVDDSVDASTSHPDRKPGRTVTDGITNGTYSIKSSKVLCHPGDVGQGALITYRDRTTQNATITSCNAANGNGGDTVTVAGATPVASSIASITANSNTITVSGVSGTISVGQVALITSFPTTQRVTVTAVVGQTVTLSEFSICKADCGTASARFYDKSFVTSQSQANVQLYISLAGIPVTDSIGNCALAIDNRDADTNNWKNRSASLLLSDAVFRDMSVLTMHERQNHSGGFCLQGGSGMPYGSTFENIRIVGPVYGFAYIPYDTNPLSGNIGLGGDYNIWNSIDIGAKVPMIIYNSAQNKIASMELGSSVGPQIVSAWSATESYPSQWEISLPEMESNISGGVGLRLEGNDHVVTNTTISGNGSIAVWDAQSSKCISCQSRMSREGYPSALLVGGPQNIIELSDFSDSTMVIDDLPLGNKVTGFRQTSAYTGKIFHRPVALNGGRSGEVNERTADFLDGSATAPYMNRDDLWVWPQDEAWGGGMAPTVVADPASETGSYSKIDNNYYTAGTAAWPSRRWVIGANLPAKTNILWIRAKCPHASQVETFTVTVWIKQPGGTNDAVLNSPPLPCSTSYQSVEFSVAMGLFPGDHVEIGYKRTDEVDIAWRGWEPARDDFVETNSSAAAVSGLRLVSTVTDTAYSGRSGVADVPLYVTPNDHKIHQYQFCWYQIVLASSGGGASYGSLAYTTHGHLFPNIRLSGSVPLMSQYSDSNSPSASTCTTFDADPNTRVSYSLKMEAATGAATVNYSGKLIDLGPVQ